MQANHLKTVVLSFVFLFITGPANFSLAGSVLSIDQLIEKAKAEKLATDPQWLKILHYNKTFFGGYKSEADGKGFFNSPEGKKNPEAELIGTLKAFAQDETGKDQHPQCRFPARYLWLKSKLHFDSTQLIERHCSRFETFKEALSAKSVSVVFSSYYLNNPASAFGHSFLKINKTTHSQPGNRFELLDYGISYAAVATMGNPVIYAINGVFGLFPGSFTSIPYYYKVREYNDYESRDLWEYDLNLTPWQVQLLVAHLWELGSTYFDYYYLSENCAYHVLSILEAANPNLGLIERLPSIVIPADTIRVIVKTPGLVSKIHYRPSSRVQFFERNKTLSSKEKAIVQEITKHKNLSEFQSQPLTEQERVHILDAAVDYIDYKFNPELLNTDSEPSRLKQTLLGLRSQIPVMSEQIVVKEPTSEMPHLGHDTARVGLDYGYGAQTGHQLRGHFRFALHDLLDPTSGYPTYAQIEFFSTLLRYDFDPKTLYLDDFALLRVISLSPWNEFNRQPSWRLKIGAKTVRDQSCNNCLAGDLSVGAGITYSVFSPMIEAEISGSPDFNPYFARTGIGPSLLVRIPFSDKLHSLLQGSYKYQFPAFKNHNYNLSAETRYALTNDFALNFKLSRVPQALEFYTGVFYYF